MLEPAVPPDRDRRPFFDRPIPYLFPQVAAASNADWDGIECFDAGETSICDTTIAEGICSNLFEGRA